MIALSLGLLAVLALTPDAAAATAQAADALVGVGGLVVAGLGAGIVVQLRAQRFDEKGDRAAPQDFRLDSEAENFGAELAAYGDAKAEEGAAPVRAELAATAAERDDFRTIAIDEVLRVQQLSHEGDDEFDADEERAYLESLPAKTLKLHFKKAREKGVSLTTQTSGEEPADKTEDAAYGNVTVS